VSAFVAAGYGRDRGRRIAPPSAASGRSASFRWRFIAYS